MALPPRPVRRPQSLVVRHGPHPDRGGGHLHGAELVGRAALVRDRLQRDDPGSPRCHARLADQNHDRPAHGRRNVVGEPQHPGRGRRRQHHPHHGDLSRVHAVRPGVVTGCAARPCRRRPRHRTGRRQDRCHPVVGDGRAALLGLRHSPGDRLACPPVVFVGGARSLVLGQQAPAPARDALAAGRLRVPGAQRRNAGDRRTGLSDLLHRRLVQDPGPALAGGLRTPLRAPSRLLHPLARALHCRRRQRRTRPGSHLLDGHGAGGIPVHPGQPQDEERAAGGDDRGTSGDRGTPRHPVPVPHHGRVRRGVPADCPADEGGCLEQASPPDPIPPHARTSHATATASRA